MSPSIAEWTRAWAERSGVQLWFAPETASTNTVARDDFGQVAASKLAPILYLTPHQTHGRGRGANIWIDSDGALLSSWSFHVAKAPQPILAPLLGLAVHNAATKIWPSLQWSLKAPNDLYLGSKKVAGLLIETIERGAERRVIVGLGMNVLSAPPDVITATHIQSAHANVTETEWSGFLQGLMVNFMSALKAGQNTTLSGADAKALLAALNRRPNVEEKIEKVEPNGDLRTRGGVISWHSL